MAGRRVWVFLESRRFGSKTLVFAYWISLDFLGFSRPNRVISMCCAGFSRNFFRALSWRRKPARALKVEAIGKGGIAHQAKLTSISDYPQSIVGSYSVIY
jgi:hypothetical protein